MPWRIIVTGNAEAHLGDMAVLEFAPSLWRLPADFPDGVPDRSTGRIVEPHNIKH